MLVVTEGEHLPVAEARAGNPEAWDKLFRRYQLPLYVYVYQLLADEQTSLDVVQETFINAARFLGTLRDDDRFGSWLFGIARQKCIQRWRKRGVDLPTLEPEPEYASDEPGPDELLLRKEQEREFMNALNHLPEPQREVLLLHYLEEFPIDQIAEVTQTSIGTVKSRLHYARKNLRKLMDDAI